MKLPLRAVPRAELEEGRMRLIEDAAGDIVARVFEDEAAEALVLAVNHHAPVVDALERVCTHGARSHEQIRQDWDNARACLRKIKEPA